VFYINSPKTINLFFTPNTHTSLTKDSLERPKFSALVEHALITAKPSDFNVGEWYRDILEQDA